MQTFRGTTAPHNPSEGDIAAEYFGISVSTIPTHPSEKNLILVADPTVVGQQAVWGEAKADWIKTVGNVKKFLQKTSLEYTELLALLDLKFINPTGNIVIQHLDTSCDTDKKVIQGLDAPKLDHIHRFLRLWHKLNGWKLWELDWVIRCPGVGNQTPSGEWQLNELFLINLFYFSQLKDRLGGKTTVEQVCALFGDLNTETHFTKLHEKRGDALYQTLFLNKRLIQPLDLAFEVTKFDVAAPTTEKISAHHPTVLAALGIRETDLVLLKKLTSSDGTLYIPNTDDLTLSNLSFLWRHTWLSKLLKFKAEDWQIVLKLFPHQVPSFANAAAKQSFLESSYHIRINTASLTPVQIEELLDKLLQKVFYQNILDFACPKSAFEFLEKVDHLKASGFTLDELNWLLASDRLAKVATKETDAARFLAALGKDLQTIKDSFAIALPTDVDGLKILLTSVLQKLNRNEAEVNFFLATMRGSVLLEASVQGLPSEFTFPAAIVGAPNYIPIRYEQVLRFTGTMTATQRDILLSDSSLASVTGVLAYQQAIDNLFQQHETATVTGLPPGFTFPATITTAPNNISIRCEQVLRFAGIMTVEQQDILLNDSSLAALTDKAAYRDSIGELLQQSQSAITDYASVSAKIALQTGVTLPIDRPSIPVRYDAIAQTLSFIGLMTTDEQAALKLSNPTATAAIDELFLLPRLAVRFYEPIFTASLADLPTAVDFKAQLSDDLAAKISYDMEQRLLRFAGIMTQAEQADLYALVPNTLPINIAYHNAVNSLATQPQTITPPSDRIWLTDNDLDASSPFTKRLTSAIQKATTYLSKALAENMVVQQASTQLGLTEALTRLLLTHYAVLPSTLLVHLTGNFTIDTTTFNGWYWATRVATIWKNWKITFEELGKIIDLTNGAQLLDFLTLPLDDTQPVAAIDRFLRTSRLLRLRDSLPESKITLLEVLEKLNAGNYAAAYFAADVEQLNEDWFATDVEALTSSLDLVYPADYLLAESWERLRQAFDFLDSLNANVITVKSFATTAMTLDNAKTLKELLRSKFGTETWLTLSAEIQDILRERKRDALAAYLLTQPQPADTPSRKWENTNDLYAYYLLDVEMGSCQLTSRLVQGSGSIQLFVQRCFMGLEPDVVVRADSTSEDIALNAEDADVDSAWCWWKWMRKYRVWEANRKVFLWPENWIEPELKKDRSPFFKDLENELLQNEINQDTVEKAFVNYLEKLDGVAQLEIAGFYQEDDGDNTIVHVFGRTPGAEPHLYYYRRYDYYQWTPWERVDLDIQGDYLIPAVVGNRLFLFWPVFTEAPDEEDNSQVSIPTPGQTTFSPDKTKKRLRLQMAVSDYRQGKWTPKRVSKDFDESKVYEGEIVKNHYRFFPVDRGEIDGRFGIKYEGFSLGTDKANKATLDGAFEITGCKGIPEKTYLPGNFIPAMRPEQDAVGEDTKFLKWVELGNRPDAQQDDFTLKNNFPPQADELDSKKVLKHTPGVFKMTPPWHLSYLDKLLGNWLIVCTSFIQRFGVDGRSEFSISTGIGLPFFYNDKKRTFFVLPVYGERSLNYYPNIKKSLRLFENGLEVELQKILRLFENGLEVELQKNLEIIFAAPTLDQQPETEQFLWQLFPEKSPPPYTDKQFQDLLKLLRQRTEEFLWWSFSEESPPPYTDKQLQDLLKRWWMLYLRSYMGVQFLSLFQLQRFHFKNYYHPFVCDFAKLVYNPLEGIPALMSRETQLKNTGFSFDQVYQPTDAVVELPPQYPPLPNCYPVEYVDFTSDGAYASYNWELFFHAPLLIANSLSKNQRFEEARDWYHFIFNPIGVESATPGDLQMSKYWITKPFFETTSQTYVQQRIDNILRMLAGDKSVPGYSIQAEKGLEDQVKDWRTNPFEPHRIANYRTVAYQKTVVMKYLDNLIAWGDNLFRQDSMESINEASQLYILAAEILGPRPKKVPPQAKPPQESFNELEPQFDKFSNALVQMENFIPVLPGKSRKGSRVARLPMLYFCIPQNEKMLGYWDTVADRLYKIRHCMNIEGVVRQLALFEPPIDPGALVKAVAGGVDISSALADLNAPLPLYRFNVLLQKANEVCNDVKALGSALLSALEKKDAEAMGLLRQSQEIRLLEAVKDVREKQIEEATAGAEALCRSKTTVEERRNYYRDIEKVSNWETASRDTHGLAIISEVAATILNATAATAHLVPDVTFGVSGLGSPVATVKFGGDNVGKSAFNGAALFSGLGGILHSGANLMATQASNERRWEDWKLQERLAEKELLQIDMQITAADLRVKIAQKELDNHVIQIENAKATDDFMRSKYTNQELYQWQIGQISGVYFQSYRLAYDLAKRAERCFRFELGLQDSSYINFGYWDSLKKGLLSGEKLQHDLRRLETAYLEQNRREFELTKHISLALLDPLALIKLRETGRCFINLPEEIFDLDYPGHYFRRIKSVSVTLPCVVGSYTTIPCTLRLLKNSIRINTKNAVNYPRSTNEGLPTDDDRFIENNIPVKAIATSSAQNDSGVFELSFRDERYLPFEGAGAISQWSLELFSDLPSNNPDPTQPDFGKPFRQFDYGTISDAILHIKYTAREDAGVFKNGAIAHLRDQINKAQAPGSVRLFSLRHEFPTEWAKFKSVKIQGTTRTAPLTLNLRAEHYPYWSQGHLEAIKRVDVFAETVKNQVDISTNADGTVNIDTLVKDAALGNLRTGKLTNIPLPPPIGQFILYFNDNSMEDLWMALTWGKA